MAAVAPQVRTECEFRCIAEVSTFALGYGAAQTAIPGSRR
jgi:hypothetical protein